MNNKIVPFSKSLLSFTRLYFRCTVNNQLIQNIPQKIFSERILIDMRGIESIWRRSKDNNVFNNHMYKCYTKNSELLTYTIDIINCASSRFSDSPTLVYEMIKTFSNYIKDYNVEFSPTVEQKIDVLFSILSFKNYQVIQLACNVFKLYDPPLICKKFIENLIREQKFTEAAYVTSALHLQKEFDFKEILIPLLLEGSVQTSSIYMTNHPDIQLKIAKFLDGYLINHSVPIASRPRKVFKTLSSLINIFKIPVDNCPNLQYIRSKGAINHLVQRRKEQSVSEATFEDMIRNVVRDDEDLQKYLIQKLIKRREKKTALKMAEIFNIKDSDLLLSETDCEVSAGMEGDQYDDLETALENQEKFEIYDISDEYLKLDLKADDIVVVDTKESFINCINEVQNYSIIGIDSEWKPHFGLSRDRLSLIQLAVHDKVYMIDVLLLSQRLETEDWDKFLDDIFGNPNIIKLGCGIMSDVNMILETIKGTNGKAIRFSHILDMVIFYHKLQEVYPVEMINRSDKPIGKSLSTLCDIILGKPLNKEDRLCDWEKRPLLERQLEYAALDAHCLLKMYDKLKEESVEKNMNFEHLAKVAIVLTTSQWKPKRKYKAMKRSTQAVHFHSAVPIEQLKVVMDSSFETQGRELRKLGADVVILEGINSAETAVELSKTEGRIIACSQHLYEQVQHKVKEGFCYCFSSEKEKEIKVTHFLQHFNAQVSTKSIFSRCVNCNSKCGMKLSAEDVKIFHELDQTSRSINSILRDNINSFSSELQTILTDILNSDMDIKFFSQGISFTLNENAFICKTCGHIS